MTTQHIPEPEQVASPTRLTGIYAFFKRAYETSPINFSTLTGFSHWEIPHLTGDLISGRSLQVAQRGMLANLLEAAALAYQHPSGACSFWLGVGHVLLITQPHHIKQALVFNHQHLARARGIGSNVKHVFGESIFFDTGSFWRQKRRLWKEWLYVNSALNQYAPLMLSLVDDYRQDLSSSEGDAIDLQRFFNSFTLDLIGQPLMARENLSTVGDQLIALLESGLQKGTNPQAAVQNRLQQLWKHLACRDDPVGFDAVAASLQRFFKQAVIAPHEETRGTMRCLLSAIYELHGLDLGNNCSEMNEGNEKSEAAALGDGIFLVFAGYQTTASTFQFMVKLLAAHPNVAAKLHDALRAQLKDEVLTVEAVEKVAYLDWVIKETLRLYPPVPIMSQGVTHPFDLVNTSVNATQSDYLAETAKRETSAIPLARGSSVMISPYIIHRLESLFPNANQFIPERFAPENKHQIPAYGYLPFGCGPHACIGQRFALRALKLLLAAIYRHHQVNILDNDMSLDAHSVTLKPAIKPVGRFVRFEGLSARSTCEKERASESPSTVSPS